MMSDRLEDSATRSAPAGPRDSQAYPRAPREAEHALLCGRRRAAGVPFDDGAAGAVPPDMVGLALSGGGIRSATFCLGFCQALARQRLLRSIDYLSTVSGGGYVGSFLGALIARQPADGIGHAEPELADDCSRVVDWLRDNGRYLSPNGSGDEVLAGAVLLRNAVSVQAVLLTAALAVLSFAIGLRVVGEVLWNGAAEPGGWSPYFAFPLLAFVLVSIPHAWASWLGATADPDPP